MWTVQRILSKHKKELRKIEENYLQEQTKIKQELVEKHEESMRRLRDKMEEQREDIQARKTIGEKNFVP